MIASGEVHSEESKAVIEDALEIPAVLKPRG
jgi:hypothetical protein